MKDTELRGFMPVSVTLEEMMQEREQRATESARLIDEHSVSSHKQTVICMTMNLIGEYKQLPLSHTAFVHHYKLLELALPCIKSRMYSKSTGDVAHFVVDAEAKTVKTVCEKIEDNGRIGRLFDIDVFASDGSKLSRDTARKCLICNKPAAECARSRAHGIESVRSCTTEILQDFFAKDITELAKSALIDEVDTTPKPGLVDRNNSGANPDMDYDMFINSANAIAKYIGQMFSVASAYSVLNPELAEKIRTVGIEAESAMYATTNGINTHKGAIYSMGLLSAGAGFVLSYGGSLTDAIAAASKLAIELSYDIRDTSTHGLEVCKKYGVTGARGEAIGGFKTVLYAFERIKHYVDDCMLDTNTAYPLAINDIMAVMKDTNVLHRGGLEGLEYVNRESKEIGEMRMNQRIDDMLDLDKELIERNISPGGCADVLACAIFLLKLEHLFINGRN